MGALSFFGLIILAIVGIGVIISVAVAADWFLNTISEKPKRKQMESEREEMKRKEEEGYAGCKESLLEYAQKLGEKIHA